MDVELIEIRDFLAERPPFAALPEQALERLPRNVSVRYLRRGSSFPPPDADQPYIYVVRTGALEIRDSRDELISKLAEGDMYSAACDPEPVESDYRTATVEDSLFYLIPCTHVRELRDRHRDFDEHFTRSVRVRLRRALESLQETPASGSSVLSVAVRQLIAKAPVHVPPDATIQQAAQRMAEHSVSALLVMENQQLLGLITEKDLSARCVARGLPIDRPVSEIMSRDLHTVTEDTRGFEALMIMMRRDIHHLPVLREDEVRGVISTTDLIRYQSTNAIYLVRDVRKSESVEGLARVSKALPELQVQMTAMGATAHHLGQAIASVTDAITQRLIELAEARLGAPPVPYVWMACGSQGRREQMVHTDQDNALLISDEMRPEHDAYFAELAREVCEGLDACGFILCPGDVMATNPKWRQPYRNWVRNFESWISDPERKSVMLAANFFDLRAIRGDEQLFDRLQQHVLEKARDNRIFLAYMAANAVKKTPPLGFFRNLVVISGGDHDNTLDLKHRGLLPISDLARVYALSGGSKELNTIHRLRIAREAGIVSREGGLNLEDAFELISALRARHQADQIKRGESPDNYVSPEELSPLERNHLKDAFGVISTIQKALSQRYQTERFY